MEGPTDEFDQGCHRIIPTTLVTLLPQPVQQGKGSQGNSDIFFDQAFVIGCQEGIGKLAPVGLLWETWGVPSCPPQTNGRLKTLLGTHVNPCCMKFAILYHPQNSAAALLASLKLISNLTRVSSAGTPNWKYSSSFHFV